MRQFLTPGKSTVFVARHAFLLSMEVTVYHDCKRIDTATETSLVGLPVNYCDMLHRIIIISITSQLLLTSHPRCTVVLLDAGTPGTSKEIYSENAGL